MQISRATNTIQTHSGVSIPLSNSATQVNWMDCSGFDKIDLTLANDASTTTSADILWSHDGATIQGRDQNVIASGAGQTRVSVQGGVSIKARYAKVQIVNGDAAAAHVISAWAYFKS